MHLQQSEIHWKQLKAGLKALWHVWTGDRSQSHHVDRHESGDDPKGKLPLDDIKNRLDDWDRKTSASKPGT